MAIMRRRKTEDQENVQSQDAAVENEAVEVQENSEVSENSEEKAAKPRKRRIVKKAAAEECAETGEAPVVPAEENQSAPNSETPAENAPQAEVPAGEGSLGYEGSGKRRQTQFPVKQKKR